MSGVADGSQAPTLSVVIAAWTGGEALRRCIDSLNSQLHRGTDEIIVARNFALDDRVGLDRAGVVDIALLDATVPQLRGAGLAASRGKIVAFIEDHCACAPGWRDAICSAHVPPRLGVGGPVDLAPGGRPLDWAVYFYDYARFTPPQRSGAIGSLSGANASYQRAFLQGAKAALEGGVVETVLEEELRRTGSPAWLSADAIVVHAKRNSPGKAIGLAFGLARGYGSRRLEGSGAVRRATFAAGALLLPVLLSARIVASALRTRRHLWRLAGAGPWLLVLVGAWSAGEFTGYLAGPGASTLRWK